MDLNWLPPLDDGDHQHVHGGAVQSHGGLMYFGMCLRVATLSNWEATAKSNTLRTDLHLTYEKSTQCITFDQDQWSEEKEVKSKDSQQLGSCMYQQKAVYSSEAMDEFRDMDLGDKS